MSHPQQANYESPSIRELGSVADFTRGEGFHGSHDNFTLTWGKHTIIDIDYGRGPSS